MTRKFDERPCCLPSSSTRLLVNSGSATVKVNLRMRYIGLISYGDNGKEDGNSYNGFQRVQEFRVSGFSVLGVQGFGGHVWGSGFRGLRFRVVGGGKSWTTWVIDVL